MRGMLSWRSPGLHAIALAIQCCLIPVQAASSYSISCQAGAVITAFPGCNAYYNVDSTCPPITDRKGQENCYCNQAYLDSVFDCENEYRLCFRSNDLDSTFDDQVLLWHSLCDGLMASPTTPAASSFTPFPDDYCEVDVKLACASAESLLNECLAYVSETDTSQFSSCTCRPQLQRQDYTCEYIGNATCLGAPAALSSLYAYSGCPNFADVMSSISAAPGASQSEPTSTVVPTFPASATPGSSSSATPSPTKPSGSSNGSVARLDMGAHLLFISLAILYTCL